MLCKSGGVRGWWCARMVVCEGARVVAGQRELSRPNMGEWRGGTELKRSGALAAQRRTRFASSTRETICADALSGAHTPYLSSTAKKRKEAVRKA